MVRVPLAQIRKLEQDLEHELDLEVQLREENEALREELESLGESYDAALDDWAAARARARCLEREAAAEARRREAEEYARWEARQRAVRDLERARAYGDPWAEERALRRLQGEW